MVLQINVLLSADYRNPFVEFHPEHPKIIYILEAKKTVVIPCRVTSPDIRPKLFQVSGWFGEIQTVQRSALLLQWVNVENKVDEARYVSEGNRKGRNHMEALLLQCINSELCIRLLVGLGRVYQMFFTSHGLMFLH